MAIILNLIIIKSNPNSFHDTDNLYFLTTLVTHQLYLPCLDTPQTWTTNKRNKREPAVNKVDNNNMLQSIFS